MDYLPTASDLCALQLEAYTGAPTWASDTAHAVGHDCGSYVVVSLKGTNTLEDIVTDIRDLPWLNHKKLGIVPAGFAASAESIFSRVLADVQRPIIWNGHSLGGAQAHIMAALAVLAGRAPLMLTTCGCPKTGSLLGLTKSIPGEDYWNYGDPVPLFPLGYDRDRLMVRVGTPDTLIDISRHLLVSYSAALASRKGAPAEAGTPFVVSRDTVA